MRFLSLLGVVMTGHRASLGLEELGSRVVPSATPLPGVSTAGAITSTFQPGVHALAGQGQGVYTNPVVPGALTADALTTYNFAGTANLAGMGAVRVTGTVHSVGFVLSGQAHGQLTFSNSRGSVTIELIGPPQPGFSALPTAFSYRVVAHSGAFAQLADHGTLGLRLAPQLFNYVPQPRGLFALVI